jgi:hypothetical protein
MEPIMNFTISADQEADHRWRGRVSFGGMLVWETVSSHPDADAAMGTAQWDLAEGVGSAIRANLTKDK